MLKNLVQTYLNDILQLIFKYSIVLKKQYFAIFKAGVIIKVQSLNIT